MSSLLLEAWSLFLIQLQVEFFNHRLNFILTAASPDQGTRSTLQRLGRGAINTIANVQRNAILRDLDALPFLHHKFLIPDPTSYCGDQPTIVHWIRDQARPILRAEANIIST